MLRLPDHLLQPHHGIFEGPPTWLPRARHQPTCGDPAWDLIQAGYQWTIISNLVEEEWPANFQNAMNSSNAVSKEPNELEMAATMAQGGMGMDQALAKAKSIIVNFWQCHFLAVWLHSLLWQSIEIIFGIIHQCTLWFESFILAGVRSFQQLTAQQPRDIHPQLTSFRMLPNIFHVYGLKKPNSLVPGDNLTPMYLTCLDQELASHL